MAVNGYPDQVRKIQYSSSADNTMQSSLFYAPATNEPAPLLVALHTWNGDYLQEYHVPCAQWCIENGWIFIHPHFRGVNNKPEAAGSELVVKDIISAVEHVERKFAVEKDRICLIGASGGGYTALLMAGRAPEIWAGVSVWVPIADLQAWYYECEDRRLDYAEDIENLCSGIPLNGSEAEKECVKRSPFTYLRNAKAIPLDINAGINDGHTGTVPISHALRAFNAVAEDSDRLSEDQIAFFTENAEVPPALQGSISDDPLYGEKNVLFRRLSGKARITVFNGGHEIIFEPALQWLADQRKDP